MTDRRQDNGGAAVFFIGLVAFGLVLAAVVMTLPVWAVLLVAAGYVLAWATAGWFVALTTKTHRAALRGLAVDAIRGRR